MPIHISSYDRYRSLYYAFAILLFGVLMQAVRTIRLPLSQLCRPGAASSTAPARTAGQARKMHVQAIPMWESTGKNFAYLVTDDKTKDATIIDPANPPEVLPVLKERIDKDGIKLQNIMNTHHHADHAGGNADILKTYPLPIIGGKDCAHVTSTPSHNSTHPLSLSSSIKITALHTPCHTQDSICWHFTDSSTHESVVFTGDTLFTGGCGRFFEGTAEEMHKALNSVLAALPDDTKVYPGHEYTAGNVAFASSVMPSDPAIKKLSEYTKQNKRTEGKFTIGDEKRHNVFMRVEEAEVEKVTGKKGAVEVMGRLREMKNAS